jgi:tRNA-binding EMAP/Myf-like protein
VVGEVLTAEKHPNADKLRLCTVSDGKETLQIVCGAPNARAGIKVVLARPGTVIPATGEALKIGKIRDVESRGMMCSARELLLGEDHDGIIELKADAKAGQPVAGALEAAGLLANDPLVRCVDHAQSRRRGIGIRHRPRLWPLADLVQAEDRESAAGGGQIPQPHDHHFGLHP